MGTENLVMGGEVAVHNASEVLFRLSANPSLQRDSIFTTDPSDVLDHATSEIASGSKLGIDAKKKIPGESFKRSWPPLIKMDESVRKKVDGLFGGRIIKPESHLRRKQTRKWKMDAAVKAKVERLFGRRGH